MNEPLGFTKRERPPCDHRGLWAAATVAGYGIMFCEGCGQSFFLKKEQGDLFWQEAHRITEAELEQASETALYAGAGEREEDAA